MKITNICYYHTKTVTQVERRVSGYGNQDKYER